MVDEQTLESRRKEGPAIDKLTTPLWSAEMGKRLALVRMRLLLDQKSLGQSLGVTQSTISRIESGYLRVAETISVAKLKSVFPTAFAFIVFGRNPERYNASAIVESYWSTRLRVGANKRKKHSI